MKNYSDKNYYVYYYYYDYYYYIQSDKFTAILESNL